MTQCPDHPGRAEATLGSCRYCIADAAHADHEAGAARVRAARAAAPRPPHAAEPTTPVHDLARARARADREARK